MTPKEKAKELFDKYLYFDDEYQGIEYAKKSALIAVNEIIPLLPNINDTPPIYRKKEYNYYQYWLSVKREIKDL